MPEKPGVKIGGEGDYASHGQVCREEDIEIHELSFKEHQKKNKMTRLGAMTVVIIF